jgi:phosphoserine phosphatase RsbU/P
MQTANRPVPLTVDAPPPCRRRVLIAEDSAAQRRLLAILLARQGYEVLEAESGNIALAMCREEEPDLVLADWLLPDMTGIALCQQFRALPRQNYGYFVLLTSNSADNDIVAAIQAGADDFLAKPVAAQELLGRVSSGERIMRIEEELRASNAQLKTALDRLRQTQEALDRDLREARKLQQGLVRERSGQFGQFEVSLLLRPAGHIGGDLVGFFAISPERIGFYALDVAGHGVTAALLTAQLSVHLSGSSDQNVALRGAQAGQDAVSPMDLAHFFNNMMLEEMSTDSYFTMIYGDLNHATGELRMVQAGHPHPVLQRQDGRMEQLGKGGMPIGVFERPVFDAISARLQPGDRLLVMSDGITEASAPGGRQLGDEGVEAIMRTNAFLHGHAFLESMAWSISNYCRGERPDDMSAIMIEYRGEAQLVAFPQGPEGRPRAP